MGLPLMICSASTEVPDQATSTMQLRNLGSKAMMVSLRETQPIWVPECIESLTKLHLSYSWYKHIATLLTSTDSLQSVTVSDR